MSKLTIRPDTEPGTIEFDSTEHARIAERLAGAGIRFERWETPTGITPDMDAEAILAAYSADIERLRDEDGYQAVDVVSMWPDHPEREAARTRFLDEHTHSEDEVRFFVSGQGLFSLHLDDRVLEVVCEAGDLIGVPAGTPHWFDMGPAPRFTAIRLFNNPEGWVAQFTGSTIASRFTRLDNARA